MTKEVNLLACTSTSTHGVAIGIWVDGVFFMKYQTTWRKKEAVLSMLERLLTELGCKVNVASTNIPNLQQATIEQFTQHL